MSHRCRVSHSSCIQFTVSTFSLQTLPARYGDGQSRFSGVLFVEDTKTKDGDKDEGRKLAVVYISVSSSSEKQCVVPVASSLLEISERMHLCKSFQRNLSFCLFLSQTHEQSHTVIDSLELQRQLPFVNKIVGSVWSGIFKKLNQIRVAKRKKKKKKRKKRDCTSDEGRGSTFQNGTCSEEHESFCDTTIETELRTRKNSQSLIEAKL